MDEAIVRYVRRVAPSGYRAANAERIKVEAGSAIVGGDTGAEGDRGARFALGKPMQTLSCDQVAEAFERSDRATFADFIQRAVEELPVEYRADVIDRGISLSGGGAMLHGLDEELHRRLGLEFVVPEHPTHCVVKGTAKVLESLREREHLLIEA
ncbi:MAG: rod shape-determining protein [Hyphomicrobiaceae bacterium]